MKSTSNRYIFLNERQERCSQQRATQWPVESSTKEQVFTPVEGWRAQLVWLQREKTVGDQQFKSFALFTGEDQPRIITSSRVEQDRTAQLGLYLCHPVQEAVQRACPAIIHGSEVTSRTSSQTWPQQVPLSQADKAYMYVASYQGRPTPFAVLEFKDISVIDGDKFIATRTSTTTFDTYMKDINTQQFKKLSNSQT
ncbi:hypothetical protein HDV63DRAFT_49658 [Trichoderma sp. SZMC 28014]